MTPRRCYADVVDPLTEAVTQVDVGVCIGRRDGSVIEVTNVGIVAHHTYRCRSCGLPWTEDQLLLDSDVAKTCEVA